MKYTHKKNQTIFLNHNIEYERFYIIQGSVNYDDYLKLKKILRKMDISYKYLGIKNGFHTYNINVEYKHNTVNFGYMGLTDNNDNTLKVYDILYEIAEIYCSDKTNPYWKDDKSKQKLFKDMFTNDEIEVFPSEIV